MSLKHISMKSDPAVWLVLSSTLLKRLSGVQETRHNLTVNLTTLRVWCYACSKEVFLERKLGPGSPLADSRTLPSPQGATPVRNPPLTPPASTLHIHTSVLGEVSPWLPRRA